MSLEFLLSLTSQGDRQFSSQKSYHQRGVTVHDKGDLTIQGRTGKN